MEHYYSAYTRTINNNLYFFIKKYIRYNEVKDTPAILEGFGMHTDFDKACNIAGIKDAELKEWLKAEARPSKVHPENVAPVIPILSKNFRVEHVNNRTALVNKLSGIKKSITDRMPQWMAISHS
jgi:hypothetical protein